MGKSRMITEEEMKLKNEKHQKGLALRGVKINDDGCPCAGNCCNVPNVICPEHICNKNKNGYCSNCDWQECLNCGEKCH